jgi:hypothetical protein
MLLWSCVFIYVVFCSFQITQVDIWWQLPEGFQILHTFHLPTEPVAAFGLPAEPYFDEYAGYEVVLACIYKSVGFFGIWILSISIYLAIIFLPSFYSRSSPFPFDIVSCLSLLLAGVAMKSRLDQRPELVGVLLQVLLMMALRGLKLEAVTKRALVNLFIIFVVWTNVHSSFTIGLFTLSLWGACELMFKFKSFPLGGLIKNALLLGAVSMTATLLNPYGVKRLWFPFTQAFDPGATALSPEMWPVLDLQGATGVMILILIALLGWSLLTSKATPLWIGLFSLFSIYMTFRSFRCISLLALSLLFVSAARDAQRVPVKPGSPLLALVKIALLCFLCLFMAFCDAFSFILSYDEIKNEKHFAQHTSRFASDSFAPGLVPPGHRLPVLCDHSEGSYLSFDENTTFRPLLDTGLAHFSRDFKRYYFFTWHEPDAFKLALASLNVPYVIIDRHTFHWVLELRDCPGWTLKACSEDGMLWQRGSGGSYVPGPSEIAQIGETRDRFLSNGDVISAFCCSTLLNRPVDSLNILAKYPNPEWTDSLFEYFDAWLDTLPRDTIRGYVSGDVARLNPPLAAILCEKLGPEQFRQFMSTAPAGPKPWYWKVLQVRYEMSQGDMDQARRIFDTISINATSSATCYRLRQQMKEKDAQSVTGNLNAYGQWQTWDENSDKFILTISRELNDRIAYLDRTGPH